MEPVDNIAPTSAEQAEQTQTLLEQLSVITCRLQCQLDEVSQQLALSLSHQAEANSQPHITALRSLKASLQAELTSNQRTLVALNSTSAHSKSSPRHSSRYKRQQ